MKTAFLLVLLAASPVLANSVLVCANSHIYYVTTTTSTGVARRVGEVYATETLSLDGSVVQKTFHRYGIRTAKEETYSIFVNDDKKEILQTQAAEGFSSDSVYRTQIEINKLGASPGLSESVVCEEKFQKDL